MGGGGNNRANLRINAALGAHATACSSHVPLLWQTGIPGGGLLHSEPPSAFINNHNYTLNLPPHKAAQQPSHWWLKHTPKYQRCEEETVKSLSDSRTSTSSQKRPLGLSTVESIRDIECMLETHTSAFFWTGGHQNLIASFHLI